VRAWANVRGPVAGVLFDLGVSSAQLDPARSGLFLTGFDGPLDMRMDRSRGTNGCRPGEYPQCRGADQAVWPTTARAASRRALAGGHRLQQADRDHCSACIQVNRPLRFPVSRESGPGTRQSAFFQALRIEVNEELDVLAAGLDAALDMLSPGGRCVRLVVFTRERTGLVRAALHRCRERRLRLPAAAPLWSVAPSGQSSSSRAALCCRARRK